MSGQTNVDSVLVAFLVGVVILSLALVLGDRPGDPSQPTGVPGVA